MNTQIQQWMTPDPITINGDNTLSIAYNLMRLNNIRHLPVVDDDEKLIGIITWGDVREAKPKSGGSAEASAPWEEHFRAAIREVSEFMTPLPRSIGSDSLIQQAAELMMEHKIGGLPVVDDGNIVGIVTETDLFRFIVDSWSEVNDNVSSIEHESTPS